jgi:ABC-type oligopeptide transport system substrate-binding subunit
MPQFCAVPIDFPKQLGASAMPGAGPYYVAASSHDGIVLRRNPNYRGTRPHHFAQIDFVPYAWNPATVVAGKADVTLPFDAEVIKRFRPRGSIAPRGHQRLFIYDVPVTWLLALNTTRPLFHDVHMRRAVSFAIDRRLLSAALFGGPLGGIDLNPATDHYIPPGLPGSTHAHVFPLGGALRRAKRILAGRSGTGVFYYPEEMSQLGAAVIRNMHAIGIDLTPKIFPFSVAIAAAQTRGAPFDVALTTLNPYYPDPSSTLNALASGHSISAQVSTNDAYFNDAVYNRKLDDASRLGGNARVRAYRRLDADLARNEAPYVAFANARWPFLFSKRIGCEVWSPIPHYDLDIAALCVRK